MAQSELKKGKAFWEKEEAQPPAKKPNPTSVRPDSAEELEAWQAMADALGVSRHSLLLYLIRYGMAELQAGRLELPKETVTVERIKMPKVR